MSDENWQDKFNEGQKNFHKARSGRLYVISDPLSCKKSMKKCVRTEDYTTTTILTNFLKFNDFWMKSQII